MSNVCVCVRYACVSVRVCEVCVRTYDNPLVGDGTAPSDDDGEMCVCVRYACVSVCDVCACV